MLTFTGCVSLVLPSVDELGIQALEIRQNQKLLEGGMIAHVSLQIRIGFAPLLRGLSEQRHVQHVCLAGIGQRSLLGRHQRGNQRPHCVRMNAVVELRKGPVQIPGDAVATTLVDLQPLKFSDEVELEFDTDPGGELESDVRVCEGAAVAPWHGQKPSGASCLDPLSGRNHEAVQSGPAFNPIEFDGIEVAVVDLLPYAEEFDRVAISEPVLNQVIGSPGVLEARDIGDANIFLSFVNPESDGCPLHQEDRIRQL